MIQNKSITYNEVYSFINTLDKRYKEKLPQKLINFLKSNTQENNLIKYNLNVPLAEQNISREALSLIGLLHLNYWCESEEEKQKLRNIFKDNEKEEELRKREQYNPDKIFNRKNETKVKGSVSPDMQIINIKKESFITKVIKKLKNIFMKK